jgi:peptidoglycan/xylan/chitin deacetylase (PgdA/CDA1 family)
MTAIDSPRPTRRRAGVGHALAALGGRPLPVTGRGAAVLAYHDVGDLPDHPTDYLVTPARLREQLVAIRGWGQRIVPLATIVERLRSGASLDGLVAVTFDDALLGVAEHAVPILSDLGVPATVFVCSARRGVAPEFWPGARRTLDTNELRGLLAAGITIGSHTRTHASLTDVDDAALARELAGSKQELEDLAGAPVDLVAYPFGHEDGRVRAAAARAGYAAATTFTFGRTTPATDRFAIPRFCMGPGHTRARLAYHLARPPDAW